ncbi:MAG: hypothetical protein WC236_14905 [Gallionellaceae bacterium]|jgi:hypothetical protein
MKEFTYIVRIREDQIKQVDTLVNQHLDNNPGATVDDALDAIFTVGINVIEAATL